MPLNGGLGFGLNFLPVIVLESRISNNRLTIPQYRYEGGGSQIMPSNFGSATLRYGNIPLNELRDPCIFSEDGVDYLLYTFNGEGGIAIGSLNKND